MSFAKYAALPALVCFLLAMPVAAQAQQTDMNCNPVPYDEDRAFTQEICNSHAACRAISKFMDKTCKAVQFVQKLTGKLTQEAEAEVPNYDKLPEAQKKNWLQKVFSPNDAAEAAKPPLNPNPPMTQNDAAVDKLFHERMAERAKDNGEKVYPNGAIYDGEMKDGKPSGVGVEVYPNGTVQRGEFNSDGNEQGLAESAFPNGEVQAGRIIDGAIVSGADQTPEGNVRAGVFAEGRVVGLAEIDVQGDARVDDYMDSKGNILASGITTRGGAEPVPPPEPAGFPPEPARDVPLWSPTTPVGTVMAEEMKWDPEAKLDWAALSPEDGTNPLSVARSCQPLTGKLTALQQKQCGQDRNEIIAKLQSKDPVGERMFCQPLTGYMPPDLMEACGIKPEPPPPAQTARGVPADSLGLLGNIIGSGMTVAPARQQPPQQQPQQRVAVATPPTATSLANCIVRSKSSGNNGFDIKNNCGQTLWIEVLSNNYHSYDSMKFEPGWDQYYNDTNPVITQMCRSQFVKADPTDYGNKKQEICQNPAR